MNSTKPGLDREESFKKSFVEIEAQKETNPTTQKSQKFSKSLLKEQKFRLSRAENLNVHPELKGSFK